VAEFLLLGPASGTAMEPDVDQDNGQGTLVAELARLKLEHRDLDAAIEALKANVAGDLLQIQRLKKRKLVLRDRISFIEDELTPDIIA
jgi:hypothetical protein